MFDPTPYFVIFGVIAVVIVILVGLASAKARNQREQELKALAQRRGLVYYSEGMEIKDTGWHIFDDPAPVRPVAEFTEYFPLFRQGRNKRIESALIGLDFRGVRWFLFDYKYDETSNDSTTTYQYSVIVAQLPMALPRMILSQETGGHFLANLFGNHELQVESEEFNRRYYIETDDPKMALDLLHPVAIQTLLAQPPLEWQMTANYVMLHLPDTLSASDFEGLMGCLALFLDKIPNYYRQDHALSGVSK